MNALLMDAQTKFKKEECVEDMDMERRSNDAAMRDAQIRLRKEDCV